MKIKLLIAFIVTLVATWLAGYFGPWWAPAVSIALTTAILRCSPKQAIVNGAASLSVVYLGMMIWLNSSDDADILGKTGLLLGGLSPVMLMVVNIIIGAITGLLSGWIGSEIGRVIAKK